MAGQVLHYLVLSGGLIAIMPVLLVVTLAVGTERWWLFSRTLRNGAHLQSALRRVGHHDMAALRSLVREQPDTLQAQLVATALPLQARSADEIESHLDEAIMGATPRLSRRLWLLDTAVTIAPLLGLFGTIIGLIQTFDILSGHGGPAEVTGGIGDALVATGAGVFIAILAVCFLNALNAMLAAIGFQLDAVKVGLINRLQGEQADPVRDQFPVRRMMPGLHGAEA